MTRVERFYERLGEARVPPGTTRYQVDRALRATFGLGYDALERAWADSMTR
jgi:hypothetical protein